MQTVLAAVDQSAPSVRAAQLAAEMARRFGARLVLVHVVTPPVVPPDASGADLNTFDLAHAEGAALLQRTAASLAIDGLKIETVVHLGLAGESIRKVAGEQEADLVVVGSRGQGAVARALLGSVADWVVHHCELPVLVVR
jgi:nucleotide-binding universal stress UspA family protein